DKSVREALTALLRAYDIPAYTYPDAESFLDAYPTGFSPRNCLLVNAQLPGLNGLSLLRQLQKQAVNLPVVVFTNTADLDTRRQALQWGAISVFEKPFVKTFLVERLLELLADIENPPR
ncbi:MAG: response regulator, partial [Pseudomonadota bacterium]